MLTSTFLHIPYVNEKTEKKIWHENIRTWDDFLCNKSSVSNCDMIKKYIMLSKQYYEARDHMFFAQKLLSKHHWRAYDDFRENCCFLDIETTGLDKQRDDITVIGLYDGKDSKVFINGINLNDFKEEISKYSFIVTFNGSLFDIPFLKAKFPDLPESQFHADLRFLLRRLGYAGGLKRIEKLFGITRADDLEGLSGFDAVRLWHKYKRHDDKKALDKLVRYNIEDIENLKILMDFSYSRLKALTEEHTYEEAGRVYRQTSAGTGFR
jgi:uncharacterized protein